MSPEVRPGRLSKGGRKHIRRMKAAGLWTSGISPFEKQRKMSVASWSAACGLMNLAVITNPELRPIFEGERTRPVLREWHAACVLDATSGNGTETKARDALIEKYAPNSRPRIKETTILDVVSPLTRVIDRAVFGQRAGR
ncbi:MAG: hypothetical protein HYT06_01375 [Candidatus Levybacteria bacterium]|nr:hypothetical protein [Candidatus Levybacteria bacterium]